jgi:hypothetical protein
MFPAMPKQRRGVQPYRIDNASQFRPARRWLTEDNVRDGLWLIITVTLILGGGWAAWAMRPIGVAFADFMAGLGASLR